MSQTQRLFVGNLPVGVTENDIKQEFNAYGKVKHVDLKIKENLVDPDNPNVFAFVTLDINRQVINQCINEFSEQQYRGRYLKVSVAKENFLDRLKREREEAAQKNLHKTKDVSTELITNTSIELVNNKKLPTIEKDVCSSSSESSDSDSESETSPDIQDNGTKILIPNDIENSQIAYDEAQEEDLFIAKKKASTSLQNGKIKIEQIRGEPIHIIGKKLKDIKQFDEKAKISDLKRKESLNKMKNQYNQQKLAIKNALSSVDTGKPKRVVFEDDNENEMIEQNEEIHRKIDLFNDDDENNEDEDIENYKKDFEIKNQYEGKSGEKLIKLQSKFKLDPRFKMNEKFLDNEDNHDNSNMTTSNNDKTRSMDVDDENDERQWQIRIIEQVVGRKLNTLSDEHRKKFHKTMLHYDPTNQEDQKFLKNVQKIAESVNEENHEDDDNINKKPEPEVSKEQFYTINEDLSKSLKRRGDGFSLLSLFGQTSDDSTNLNKDVNNETKSLMIPKSSSHNIDNPFKFDSSDSEMEDINFDKTNKSIVNKMEVDANTIKTAGGKTTKIGVWNENFFIFENDQRLKDGFEFFKELKKDDNEPKEDYEKVRDKLRLIIKKKIVKSRKNLKNKKLIKSKIRRKK